MKPFQEHHLLSFLDSWDFKAPLDLALSQYFKAHKSLGSKDRKFVANTAYSIVRELALLDYHTKPPHSFEARFNTYKQIDLEKEKTNFKIPNHIRCSCPKFLFDKLIQDYGEDKALDLALKNNQRANLTIRANTIKTSKEDLLKHILKHAPATICKHAKSGISVDIFVNLFKLPIFKEGLFEVQDEGSQLVAELVDAKPGEKVLDYCSGSGGKSLAIAPQMNKKGCLFLHDIRQRPLVEAKKRFKRAGVENYQIAMPHSKNLQRLKKHMDWVLVDAPCSGSGTYRRNPDSKWKFNKQMLIEVTEKQRQIFDEAITYVKPKGFIVYATCSMLSDENEKQAAYFEKKYSLTMVKKPLNSVKYFDSMDAFYGVVFQTP